MRLPTRYESFMYGLIGMMLAEDLEYSHWTLADWLVLVAVGVITTFVLLGKPNKKYPFITRIKNGEVKFKVIESYENYPEYLEPFQDGEYALEV